MDDERKKNNAERLIFSNFELTTTLHTPYLLTKPSTRRAPSLIPLDVSTVVNQLKIETAMQELAALLLCKLGGKGSADDVKAVLTAAGLEANEDALTQLMGDVEGKEINDLLAEGAEKIKDVPFGGGGGGGGGAGAAAGGDAGEAAKEEEPEEEEADIGGGAADMFGGGDGGGDY